MIKKKWFLYCTEFIAGMSVMAVELAASRLLAPYVSSSQIVWTIIIGTIMIALALGNFYGGRLADKSPNPTRLYIVLLIAAIWICLIPLVGKYIIGAISVLLALIVTNNFLIWVTLLSCLLIFFFPLMLLGMVTPTLIKTCLNDINNSGKIVGELSALNTVGSILGTFLPTFIVIPSVGTAATFIIFSSLLFILACVYFIDLKKHLIKTSVIGVLIIALTLNIKNYRFSISTKNVLLEDESMYNYLVVNEDDEKISLGTNVLFGVQSVLYKNKEFSYSYYDFSLAATLMADYYYKDDFDVLILGLGSGTYATHLDKYFPNCNVTGVEIDEKIVNIAKKHFNLPQNCNAVVDDGRSFLTTSGKYDIIMVDAYQDITIPFWMSSIEFFELVKNHLKDDGVMVCNLNMTSSNEFSISRYLMDTINYVFDNTYSFNVSNFTNTLVFTSKKKDFLVSLEKNSSFVVNETLELYMKHLKENLVLHTQKVRILTDDKAPVELLGMQTLDEMISGQLEYYKNLFKGKSLKEILELL